MQFDPNGNYFDPGHGDFVVVDGAIVERKASEIAQWLYDYDENLTIMCLDPTRSGVNDAPYVICEKKPDGRLVRVFEAWELDARIKERLYAADQHRFDALKRVETLESIQKKIRDDRYKDKQGEMQDMLLHAVKNRTSSYVIENTQGEKVKINENAPPVRNNNRTYSYT